MIDLGIVDIREILKTIQTKYKYDFSNYALTSLKQRLEKFIIRNSLIDANGLLKKLKEHPEEFDTFLHEISVPSSEMFRDPSLWRWLREVHFANLSDHDLMNYKIWLPNCVSGGELYSLCILLHEIGLLNKVKIIASSASEANIINIKNGSYDLKKIEISAENYKRFQGSGSFQSYYTIDRYFAIRNKSLINNVEFRRQNINFDDSPINVKLIIFRNSLIYYNPTLQEKVLANMYENLSATGLLIIGIREKIRESSTYKGFEIINEFERVYKKKL
ncbi:MAG: hypothetical protein JXJ22_07110 [Bacteroidales bacterium]|nr:hypothetical protein [Bacteroidales bacterium]